MRTQILNGTNFGPCWGMSGVQNFFGEGWSHHKLMKALGILDFAGMTFVAKTTTIDRRIGNMPLEKNLMPTELIPKCIHVDFWNARVLNAVSLSGPGLRALLDTGKWQERIDPFFISFMSVAGTRDERLAETREFVDILRPRVVEFNGMFGVQKNDSCPNTGHGKPDVSEILEGLDIMKPLHNAGVAIALKLGVDTPPEVAMELEKHRCLDAICISNTIPFGKMGLPWDKWYPKGSPLVPYLGEKFQGGLSGTPLHHIVTDWVKVARARGFVKPINAGGGILCPDDVDGLMRAGADSVSLGSIAILRPWRVHKTIKRASEYST